MIEFPESRVLAEQINESMKGRQIRRVSAGHSPHKFAFYFGDPQEYQKILVGKTTGAARGVGGQVEWSIEEMRLLLSDGCGPRFIQAGEERPKKHQLLIEFENDSCLVCVVHMYGAMLAFREGTNDSEYYAAALEKPSPLSDGFSPAYFDALLSRSKQNLSVKAFLATEQRIPGLGNGVLQDILFQARLHPKTKLSSLGDAEKETLHRCVRETLFEMTSKGGRDTEKDLFGCNGGYRTILSKNTLSAPCPICGGEIVRKAFLGGNVYYCPVCQPQLD